ncbi:hypothetical protein MNEG_3917 [Monoraphidium neglectum]|uniref:Uncharacterized protein n=1 Tax=Monoraphidium neglectum TaxID=145388 RepID=A0A0D2NG59_9CHLO|nr:hypothetical protein MNEG_3917 [Monoraphidium neglectum]KIZ04046.1 hypothetical protein MNEG_3917 [Monoraphidium neglectum]|eukprot:XP_013903065.1 hypothetical protein MNEG_3917 [Monoraphidium neglectum]
MARGCWAVLAVALLLAPSALGASLRAGGLTQGAEGVIRRELGEKANIFATGGRTSGFAPSDGAPITNFGGSTSFTSAGVGFNGGLTTSFDNFRNPVVNQGGFGRIFRRLGEQGAAAANFGRSTFFNPLCQGGPAGRSAFCNLALLLAPGALGASLKAGGLTQGAEGVIRRELGEKANIMATGGRTDGFAPSDGAAITNFGGTTTFTSAGVGFNGGTTTSFDNFRNPVTCLHMPAG